MHHLSHYYFNSIKVQLELASVGNNVSGNLHFNSIKVQLERIDQFGNDYDYKFQFHKGTIRTFCFEPSAEVISDFNSIKVQLEPLSQLFHIVSMQNFNSIKVQLEQEDGIKRISD